jgi:hypothetical protein
MKNHRFRSLFFAAATLVAVWVVALVIFHFSGKARVTVGKLQQYVDLTDLDKLSAAKRDKAVTDFADMVNSLSAEERMNWRRENGWKKWFEKMNGAERAKFIEMTLPTGFKQMLDAYGQLPEDQRRKFIDDAVNKLRQAGANGVSQTVGDYGQNGPPPLSPELEQKVREIGLKEFYTDSSPETKAELAPLLEQMEIQIRGGRMR